MTTSITGLFLATSSERKKNWLCLSTTYHVEKPIILHQREQVLLILKPTYSDMLYVTWRLRHQGETGISGEAVIISSLFFFNFISSPCHHPLIYTTPSS